MMPAGTSGLRWWFGTAGEDYSIKVPAGEFEGRPLDRSALIAAVPPYDQVAMLELRHTSIACDDHVLRLAKHYVN